MLCGALQETNSLRGAVVILIVVWGAGMQRTRRVLVVVAGMVASGVRAGVSGRVSMVIMVLYFR